MPYLDYTSFCPQATVLPSRIPRPLLDAYQLSLTPLSFFFFFGLKAKHPRNTSQAHHSGYISFHAFGLQAVCVERGGFLT